MKYTNTLLLIALITFSYANTFEFASLAEVSEIQADPYGKSLLETISLSLANKGNIDDVQTLLNDLLFKLNQDQQHDDIAWAKENARLKDKIHKLAELIEKLRKELIQLRAEKAKYEKLRDQAEKNLKQYHKQKGQNQQSLIKNKERRALDHAEFERSKKEHEAVLDTIDLVIKELNHLIGSVSGNGRAAHIKENEEEKRDRLQRAFVQLTQEESEVQAFVELATSADQAALLKLINALKGIRENTRASYNDDIKHEARSVHVYEELKALLENDIKKLDRMIDQEDKNHKLYIKKVQELTIKIDNTRKLKKAKKAEKLATEKEREAKEHRYLADKAQRDQERKVIEKLQKIVKERLANMSRLLRENTQS